MISIQEMLPLLLQGAGITLQVALLSIVVAFVLSVVSGLGRLSKWMPIRFLTACYVEIFRGTSLLVQLFWMYFALPFAGIELPKMVTAILAVGLNFGAYGSEIVRSSVLAIPKGQTEAAIALNMTSWQKMRWIILPQAFVRMLPPFGNLVIELVKSTSLVYFITLSDLTYQAMILRNNAVSSTPQIMTLLLVIYFVIAYVFTLGIRWMERRVAEGRS